MPDGLGTSSFRWAMEMENDLGCILETDAGLLIEGCAASRTAGSGVLRIAPLSKARATARELLIADIASFLGQATRGACE